MWVEIGTETKINFITASKVFQIYTFNASVKSNRSYWTDINKALRADTLNAVNKNVNTAEVFIRCNVHFTHFDRCVFFHVREELKDSQK